MRTTALLAIVVAALVASARDLVGVTPPTRAAILPLEERKAVMDAWVRLRLERLLPAMMRRHGFDMWVILTNENVEDPVFRALSPEDPLAVRRLAIMVFFDRGPARGVERLIVARHEKPLYERAWDQRKETQWEALARIVGERDPKRIGINEAVKIPFGDGLTAGLKAKLTRALGQTYAARLASAEMLAVSMLETRLPEEVRVYDHVVSIAKAIIAEGFSSAVITPEVTTIDELSWWFNQRVVDLGLKRWFFNHARIIRATRVPRDDVIRRGDVLHVDFGIEYLGLATDTQEVAYVPRPGETDVPRGWAEALRRGNRMQDILVEAFQQGRTGDEIQAAALRAGRAEGLQPRIYTHPIGLHGHGAGAFVGLPEYQDGVPEKGEYPWHPDTAYSIELSVNARIPEWDDEEVRLGLEQQAFFPAAGAARFVGGRQTRFHIVR